MNKYYGLKLLAVITAAAVLMWAGIYADRRSRNTLSSVSQKEAENEALMDSWPYSTGRYQFTKNGDVLYIFDTSKADLWAMHPGVGLTWVKMPNARKSFKDSAAP